MLSLREIERAAACLEARFAGGHLERIVQRDAHTLELTLSGPPRENAGRAHGALVLSCNPRHARVGEAESFAPAPPSPLPFAQLLRARIGRTRIVSVRTLEGERQLAFDLTAAGVTQQLVLQILGPRSNVYLLDGDGLILGALRPLPDTRRDLAIGGAFTPPATPPPPPGDDRYAAIPDEAFLRAIEDQYAALERDQANEALARRIHHAIEREARRLAKRDAALRRDLERARPAGEQRRLGELLKGALHTVTPGASEVVVRDFASGQDVTIPLEPGLAPAQNLERLFRGYQRMRRRELATAEQLAALDAERTAIAQLRDEFEALGGADSLDAELLARFAARAPVAKLLGRHRPRGEGPRPARQRTVRRDGPPARLRPGRYRTSDGLEVWVGRSAEGNDHLSTRLARGHDLFFHVEDGPGSHVVLRTGGRKEIPQESLLEAAELAVHFSKLRNAGRVSLHVAPIKDVRKPRGAKPGLVHVTHGRSLALRREPQRLARILAARIEDDASAE